MKFEKEELLSALEVVRPALASKPFVPILTHFCLKDNKLIAYDGELLIQQDFDCDFEMAIPGEFFYRFISTLDGDIDCTKKGDNKLFIKCKKVKNDMQGLSLDEFPDVKKSLAEKASVSLKLTEDFVTGIKQCINFVGKDETQPQFRGVFITAKEVYATNGYIIARHKFKTPLKLKSDIFLPEILGQELIRLSDKLKTLQVSKSAIRLKGDGLLLMGTRPEVSFPDCLSIFKPFEKGLKTLVDLPNTFRQTVGRAALVTEGLLDAHCCLTLSKGKIIVEVDNKAFSSLKEEIKLKEQKAEDVVDVDIKLVNATAGFCNKMGLINSSKSSKKVLAFGSKDNTTHVLISLIEKESKEKK